MGSHANISHNLMQIESAFRWGIMQNCPIGAATSAFDLVGGYPDARMRADGEVGDTSFPAGCGWIGSIGLTLSYVYVQNPKTVATPVRIYTNTDLRSKFGAFTGF